MNKLNGWHRILIVIAPLWCVFVYFYGNDLYGNRLQTIYVTSYVTHDLQKSPRAALIDAKPMDRYSPLPYADRTMPDGVVVYVHKEFTNTEVELAYERAKVSMEAIKTKSLHDYLIKTALICFLPLLGLYAFGWTVGWIRRGFNQQRLRN